MGPPVVREGDLTPSPSRPPKGWRIAGPQSSVNIPYMELESLSSMSLSQKLNQLPESPGVYLLIDSSGTTVYIGKAKVLKTRVRSYFQEGRAIDIKTHTIRQFVVDLEFIVTDSEVEALLLESHLVKKNKPRFNVHLKDDKSFPYIKLTINETFPRIFITRQLKKDGALYFGPYLPASLARNMLKLIHKHFQLRTCNITIDGKLPRPCLDYHIKRCMGPCVEDLCTEKKYQRGVRDAQLFLEGKNDTLLDKVSHRMQEAANQENFETAALLRDQMRMLTALTQRQKMVVDSIEDADIFGFYSRGRLAALQVFTMRGSRVVGRREFFWEHLESFEATDFLAGAVRQYYVEGSFIPCEIYVPLDFEDRPILEEILSNRRGQKVKIITPKIGDRRRLIQLVERNARLAFDNRFRTLKAKSVELLEAMRLALKLNALPRRVECFDISNLQGTNSVASMVVCENGSMKKSDYRRFKIKTVQGPNDFASMHEVVYRRYKRLVEEDKALPDFVLIDGGKGQLSAAGKALSELGIEDIALASIAKEDEILFIQGRENQPLKLNTNSPVLHLIQRIRDEAHRFAVTFHRKKRSGQDFHSELDDIPGVGKKTRTKLLRAFGSVKKVRQVGLEKLTPILGPRMADRIHRHFSPRDSH